VVHEEAFVEIQLRIAPLQIPGAVAGDAVAEREILRARRGADRIGLDESQVLNRAREGRRAEQAAPDRISP
jgi:hypothetical protein